MINCLNPIKYVSLQVPGMGTCQTYIISNTGNVLKYVDNDYVQQPIYRSTSGYTYVQINICDETIVSAVDVLVAFNFKRSEYELLNQKHQLLTVHHIDNDTLNDSVYNLTFVSDQEKWKPVIDEDVKINMYEVSSYGNVRNINTKKILSSFNRGGYEVINLQGKNNLSLQKMVHRLVAQAFIPRSSNSRYIINHINGIKNNNHWKNLEWVTYSENIKHAIFFGLEKTNKGSQCPSSIIDESLAKHIWLLLIDDETELNGRPKTNGSPTTVKRYLLEDGYSDINVNIIESIKGRASWVHVTDKLPQKDFVNLQSVIDESLAKHIWLLLIDDETELNGRPKTNGSPLIVSQYMCDIGYDVSTSIIRSIKSGRAWTSVTSKLPQKDFVNLHPKELTSVIVEHIWLLLIDDETELNGRPKTNGSPTAVKRYLLEDGYDVRINIIKSIKGRTSWVHVTDKINKNI